MSKLAVGLMLLGIEAWSGYAGAETEGNVVARVGDHLVLRSDVDKALQRLPEDKRPTRQELLQTLIDRQILLLEATRRGQQQGDRRRGELQLLPESTGADFAARLGLDSQDRLQRVLDPVGG